MTKYKYNPKIYVEAELYKEEKHLEDGIVVEALSPITKRPFNWVLRNSPDDAFKDKAYLVSGLTRAGYTEITYRPFLDSDNGKIYIKEDDMIVKNCYGQRILMNKHDFLATYAKVSDDISEPQKETSYKAD